MAHGKKFSEFLDETLVDAEVAAEYLAGALEQGDDYFLAEALSRVIKAHGATKVSGETGIARQALYKMLANEGNPSFKNVSKMLEAVGLELTVRSKSHAS